MSSPIVAIIGRPNVGKSALFNRILGRQAAIVDGTPGVTRDRHYADAEWCGRTFTIVDTGGLVPDSDEPMESAIERQARMAVDEADVILLVVDARAGVTPLDQRAAAVVRRAGKRVIVVANKVDSGAQENHGYEMASLGLGDPAMISALKGRGTGDLLDLIVERFPASPEQPTEKVQAIRVAILGRPNVGKSSLINAIVGEEKVIVTDRPGTTRDSIDTHVERDGVRFILIDTAGLRRQSRVQDDIEFYSVTRTIRSLERCDVAVVLMDAVDGVSAQDMRIVARVEAAGKGLILVLNKWDLVDTVRTPAEQYTDAVRAMMRFADFAPLVFVSARTRRGVAQLLKQVVRVDEERTRRVSTGELNKAVERMVASSPPPSTPSGKFVKIFYCTQASVAPPTFVFFTNHPEALDETYKRFLTNQLRERFGFTGTTIRVLVRGRPDREVRVVAGRRGDRRTG